MHSALVPLAEGQRWLTHMLYCPKKRRGCFSLSCILKQFANPLHLLWKQFNLNWLDNSQLVYILCTLLYWFSDCWCLPQHSGFLDRHNDTSVTQSNKALCCYRTEQIAVSIITFFPFGDGEAIEVAAMKRYLFLFLQIEDHAICNLSVENFHTVQGRVNWKSICSDGNLYDMRCAYKTPSP